MANAICNIIATMSAEFIFVILGLPRRPQFTFVQPYYAATYLNVPQNCAQTFILNGVRAGGLIIWVQEERWLGVQHK